MDTADTAEKTKETTSDAAQATNEAKPLVLPSLEIKNFRAFKHLTIEKLGRVNLITGKNNVGKTSLLEALWLYAEHGSPYVIRQILFQRGEFSDFASSSNDQLQEGLGRSNDPEQLAVDSMRFLFHGRGKIDELPDMQTLEIASIDQPNQYVAVSVAYMEEELPYLSNGRVIADGPTTTRQSEEAFFVPYLVIEGSNFGNIMYRLDRIFRVRRSVAGVVTSYQMVRASSMTSGQLNILWDGIALTFLEEEVVKSLRLLVPDLERVNLIGTVGNAITRTPYVKIKSSNLPIPLKSLGDGSVRLFGIVLALLNAKDGALFLDEIENGLHYSVLPDVWRLIFQTARRLNVQVFATTHSWDCIEAFQEAASEDDDPTSGVLIKLLEENGDIISAVFDEEELELITRQQIEVR